MPRGKKAQTPGAAPAATGSAPATTEAKPAVRTPGDTAAAAEPPKRPEPASPVFAGRGTTCNDYATALAKVRSGELKPPVLTNQGWIVDNPDKPKET